MPLSARSKPKPMPPKPRGPALFALKHYSNSIAVGRRRRSQSEGESGRVWPGTDPALRERPHRVVSCRFEMEVPTNALRMNVTLSVVAARDRRRNGCGGGAPGSSESVFCPSVSYKITVCTPRRESHHGGIGSCSSSSNPQRSYEPQHQRPEPHGPVVRKNADGSITHTTTTSTLRWTSNFVVSDNDEQGDPCHEWTGSFVFDDTPVDVSACSFHQLEGTFRGRNCSVGVRCSNNTTTNITSNNTTINTDGFGKNDQGRQRATPDKRTIEHGHTHTPARKRRRLLSQCRNHHFAGHSTIASTNR
ncbi:unnamed protein product [Pseudo-nitzschia multistriata]|uniref:Uncharacterized protein n=1 Tax=Pseudo-nitzschia multistriata TaxID=183589 RepID=A0A448ZAX1_9STRA|nr:unnamed protein product [Pseudo-nitzschia multistriata]